MFHRLVTYLWYGCASLLVLAALALSIARLALPMLEVRESQLAGWVRDTVGHDLRIGRLDVAWRGWGPELRVVDVQLTEPATQQPVLTAQELRIGINLLRSLWTQQLQPARLVLIGSELGVLRNADGRLAIEGIQLQTPAANPWLIVLAQPQVELRDLRVHWRDATAQLPDAVLDDVDLRLLNRGTRHQLQVHLQLPAEIGAELHLAADLQGAPERLDDWHGELYVDVKQAPLARWLAGLLPGGLVTEGKLDARLWADIRKGRATHVIGTVAIAEPRISEPAVQSPDVDTSSPDTELFNARHIAGQVEWQRAKSGWTLNLDRIQLTDAAELWRETGMTVAVLEQDNGGHQVQLGLTYLRLETVAPWLAHVMKAAPERQALLQQMQLGGAVQALQLAFNTRAGRIHELAYQMRFEELHSTAVERIPGSTGLTGRLTGTGEHGVLELDSRAARAVLPRLFREPLALEELRGDLRWRRLDDRVRVETDALLAVNADIRTQTRLRLDIPYDGSKPFLDLQTAFSSGRVADAYKYLPVGIMPPRTVTWLDRALVSGNVDSGAFLFHGRLGDFPFDKSNGRMEVRANVSAGVLDYQEGWHRIEELEAELVFINRSMHIRGHAGKILAADLQNVDVRIDDLAHARLQVAGVARGALGDMLRYVNESPLGQGPGEFLGAVQAEGDASLELLLTLPLAQHMPAQVHGRLHFDNNRLALPDWDMAFEQLHGELQFTEKDVAAKQIQAQLLQVPVVVDVATLTRAEQRMTRIQARGRLPVIERMRGADNGIWKHFTGEPVWRAQVYLPQGDENRQRPQLELHSDLTAVAIDLPAPLGKLPDEQRDFVLRTELSKQGSPLPLQLRYGAHSAALLLQSTATGFRLNRGAIQLGAATAVVPAAPGLTINGRLDNFSLDAWRALLAGDSAETPQAALFDELRDLDLELDQLRAFDRDFVAVQVRAQPLDNGWQMQLAGPDMEGTVQMPDARDEVLQGRLQRLRIPAAVPSAATARFDPATLPPLQLEVASLQFHDLDLGHVTLHTAQLPDGVSVQQLQVDADWLKMHAQGTWTRHAEQDASRFKIQMQGGELGRLLSTFGYAGSVEGGPTFGEIEANWPGTPADFALARLEGSLALRIGPGRLLNVETGAGRVFGLFNMQGIRRRLALDFSDVFDKGFSFDRIEGHFTLLDTDAYTNDLVIEGPAARIEVSGRTGLAKQDYDQLVTVVPEVKSTLPIAGAIAGGPVVGAALLLIDRLFSQQMEDLTSFARYQYAVTGSWENPLFTPIEKGEKSEKVSAEQNPAQALQNNAAESTPAAPQPDSKRP